MDGPGSPSNRARQRDADAGTSPVPAARDAHKAITGPDQAAIVFDETRARPCGSTPTSAGAVVGGRSRRLMQEPELWGYAFRSRPHRRHRRVYEQTAIDQPVLRSWLPYPHTVEQGMSGRSIDARGFSLRLTSLRPRF
jgi:hypothetical protein